MAAAEVTDPMFTGSTASVTPGISSDQEIGDVTSRSVFAILYCIQAILTLVGNGFILFVLCRSGQHRGTPSASLAINIAVSDLLLAVALLLRSFLLLEEEKLRVWCVAYAMSMCFSSLAVQLSLMLVMVERYIAIRHPFHYISVVRRRNVVAAVCSMWGYSVVVMLLPLHPVFHHMDISHVCLTGDILNESYVLLLVVHWLAISLVCLLVNASVTSIACRQNVRVKATMVGVFTCPTPRTSHGQRPVLSAFSLSQEVRREEKPSDCVSVVVIPPSEQPSNCSMSEKPVFTFHEQSLSTFPEKPVSTFTEQSAVTFLEEPVSMCREESLVSMFREQAVPPPLEESVSMFCEESVSTFHEESVSTFCEESVSTFREAVSHCSRTPADVASSPRECLFHRKRHEASICPFLRERLHCLQSKEASVGCAVSPEVVHFHTRGPKESVLSCHPEPPRSDSKNKLAQRDKEVSVGISSPEERFFHNRSDEFVLCSRQELVQGGPLVVGAERAIANQRLFRGVRREALVVSERQEDVQCTKTSARVVLSPRDNISRSQNLDDTAPLCCQDAVLCKGALVAAKVPGGEHVPAEDAIFLEKFMSPCRGQSLADLHHCVEGCPSRRVSCHQSSSRNQPLLRVSLKQHPAHEDKISLFPVNNRMPSLSVYNNTVRTSESKNALRTYEAISESDKRMKTSVSNKSMRRSVSNNTMRPSVSNDTMKISMSNNTMRPSVSNNTMRPSMSNNTMRPSMSDNTMRPSVSNNTMKTLKSDNTTGTLESNMTKTPDSRSPYSSGRTWSLQVPSTSGLRQRLSQRPSSAPTSLSSDVWLTSRASTPTLTHHSKAMSSNTLSQLSSTLLQSSTLAESSNTLPTSSSMLPQLSNTLPQSSSTQPESSNTLPESSNTLPELSSKLPLSCNMLPQLSNTLPHSSNTLPGSSNTLPGSSNTLTESTTTLSQSFNTSRQLSSTVPESSNTVPKSTGTLPQLFNTIPQSSNTVPESSKIPPDLSSTLPEPSSTIPVSKARLPKTSLQWSLRRSLLFLKRSGVLYLLFSLSWCPFAIVELMEMSGLHQSLILRRVVATFIFITPVTNPVVYVWGNARFRLAFTQLWRRSRGEGGGRGGGRLQASRHIA